jgi:hypothetical protein
VKIETEWTGSYPNLCSGSWLITIDGENLPIPDDKINNDMNTYGIYSSWHFEDWSEVFEDYGDGLECSAWIDENKTWIKQSLISIGINPEEFDYAALYAAIQEKDWRSNSCGGCI